MAETGVSWESEKPNDSKNPASIAPFPTAHPEPQSNKSDPTPVAAYEKEDSETTNIEEISDQLISQYGNAAARHEMDPRLGLVLFFGGVLGFLGFVIFLFYWFGYR
ncbi:hypothetical protein GA003_11055 [Opitutia bacterium ISCC 52]|nr:hypothetical protein GA003_11055 [Opitutae bacterium ISCC 52]